MLDTLWLQKNASLVTLPDGSSIYQHKQGQKISSDNQNFNDLLYERFSRCSTQTVKVLELGAGNGINMIMLKKKFPLWDLTGVEIDQEQVELASYNCNLLNLDIKIAMDDLRTFKGEIMYDLIIANPPYKKVGTGRLSPYKRNNLAKFELTCTMQDVFAAIKRNVCPGGEAWLLYSLDRKDDLMKLISNEKVKKIKLIKKDKIIITGLKYDTN